MRKILIDCGSNLGSFTRHFIRGHEDYEYFLFEPLPLFHITYDVGAELTKEYPDIKLHYSDKAVWTENAEMKFYLSRGNAGGSSLCRNKRSNNMDRDHPITVRTIDFGAWLKDTFPNACHIVVKMDIEGAEYDVIPKLIEDGTIELLAELIVEFHDSRQLEGQYVNIRYEEIRHYFKTSKVKLTDWV